MENLQDDYWNQCPTGLCYMMSFLVRHRIPNFAGGDSIHPDDLEHEEIETLAELEDFQFIKDQKEMGYTTILLVKAERNEFTRFDYYICSEKPGKPDSREWVGKMVENGSRYGSRLYDSELIIKHDPDRWSF